MKKSNINEVQLFFETLNEFNEFEQIKKSYDFTDKLKPYLLESFIKQYEYYVKGLSSNPFEDDDLEAPTVIVPFNGSEIVFNLNKVSTYVLCTNGLFINILENIIKGLENPKQPKTPELNNNTAPTEKYLEQPTNKKANEFFDFLIEYYRPEDKTQIKYVNILHYLKNDADKKHFIFKVKQADYKVLVEKKTGIKISKFDKSVKYPEEEKPIFHTLENTFLKTKTV